MTIRCESLCSANFPSLPSLQSHLSLSVVVCVSFSPCHPRLTPNLAEIDALLAKEREHIAQIEELSTNLAAFRAAYTGSQDEIKRKADETAALLAELHALKVCPPSVPALSLIALPGTRETRHLSLGWRRHYILP